MADIDEFVSGCWIGLDAGDRSDGEPDDGPDDPGDPDPLADREELVLAVADRWNADPATVVAEFDRIDDRFDVDAVYLAPAPE